MWESIDKRIEPSKMVTYAAVFDGSVYVFGVPTVNTVGYKYVIRFADYISGLR